tara:strand:+ start:553 stop:1260 length:708 start_codon:yes stop_codon:yes gene_type:complete
MYKNIENKKDNKKYKKNNIGITGNIVLTDEGLFFVTDKEYMRSKNETDKLTGGGGCMFPTIDVDVCKPVRFMLQKISAPLNVLLKIIPFMLNIVITIQNKIMGIMGKILDFFVLILNTSFNKPIRVLNFIIKQFKDFMDLLLSVLRGNPLKIASLIILPYVFTASNFILSNLYVFPFGYFGPFVKVFLAFLTGKPVDDIKLVGLTLGNAINLSMFIIMGLYVACYYQFFKLIFDI